MKYIIGVLLIILVSGCNDAFAYSAFKPYKAPKITSRGQFQHRYRFDVFKIEPTKAYQVKVDRAYSIK